MNFFQTLRESYGIALRVILASRFRSFLTMLGISIGIFAITVISTLVYSLESAITDNLASLGNTVIYVHNWPWKDNSQDWFKYFNRPKVSYRDYSHLKDRLENVTGVCFEMSMGGQKIKSGKNSLENISAKGVTEEYISINDLKFTEGRFFTPIESNAGRPVAVVGATIADKLFPGVNPIGRKLLFQGKKLTIIGVLKKEGAGLFGPSLDELLVIPYTLMAGFVNEDSRSGDKLITIKAKDYESLPLVEDETIGIIRASRGLKPRTEDNFAINKQEMLMEELNSIFGSLRMGGIFISILSILVGGFGIANIMFVSVKERTNEIGIQKSLGATRMFILTQFMVESVLLCILGGILGLLLVFLVAWGGQFLLDYLDIDFKILISIKDLIFSIGLSVLIGLISGFWPANVASKMNPVEAIRTK